MEKKLFYVLVKLGRFLIQESSGEFNKNTIAALKDLGWSVHGPYPSKRQAKDEAYQQERRSRILD
jgi:hypothetical protein